jgi:transposase
MEKSERWHMYLKIQQLKRLGLNKSQIARHVGVSRNTVYKYIDMTPDEFNDYLEEVEKRKKKLDKYRKQILKWLKKYPDVSAAQIADWLEERYNVIDVSEGTVRNYVNDLREEYGIPKEVRKREYEAIEDPPMGHQMQVDFGETSMLDEDSRTIKLRCITFVLSNSRYKYIEWLDRPFTTADVIRCHENAFSYYGGIPEEIVYDQDHLILVSENHGDLILTHEFAAYHKKRDFKIYMCRKSDPESKGRVEKVVDFVKNNFARHRTYYNLEKLNEECMAWLKRRANGKKHHTTKKIPAEVFAVEKQYLKPVGKQIDTIKSTSKSISRLVRKNNTIVYLSNRYSLPLGTYDGTEKYFKVKVTADEELVIFNPDTEKEIARHHLCHEKGKLIKGTNHRRDRTKGIDAYMEQVSKVLGNTPEAEEFLKQIHQHKGRYIRDQLQLINQSAREIDSDTIAKALDYCLKYRLYSASDFKDAIKYFEKDLTQSVDQEGITPEARPLEETDFINRKIKPKIRDVKVYQQIMDGGCYGTDRAAKTRHENA